MNPEFTSELEALFESLKQQQASMVEAQRQAQEISVTVTGRKRAVSVTVDAQGAITDLSFPTEAYRQMAPKELATLVRETITKAREGAAARMTEVMAPFLPAGLSIEDFARGRVEWDTFVPPVPGDMFGARDE